MLTLMKFCLARSDGTEDDCDGEEGVKVACSTLACHTAVLCRTWWRSRCVGWTATGMARSASKISRRLWSRYKNQQATKSPKECSLSEWSNQTDFKKFVSRFLWIALWRELIPCCDKFTKRNRQCRFPAVYFQSNMQYHKRIRMNRWARSCENV